MMRQKSDDGKKEEEDFMDAHEDDFYESRQLAFSRDPLREVGKLSGVTECDVDTSAGVQVYANVMESAIVT